MSKIMSTDLVKKTNYFVKKDNAVTKALFFDISLIAYRIILLAGTDKFLAQLSDPNNTDHRIRISAAEYHEIFGKEGKHISPSYRALKQSVDELLDAKLKFKDFKSDNDEGKWSGGINWVSYAAYNDKLKVLELSFSADILPFIHDVNTRYTYYNIRNIAELTSVHSIRMYELMMFWRKKGCTPNMSITMLKAWLGIRDDSYEYIPDFNTKIVKKSVNEINAKNTDLNVKLTINKTGKVTKGYKLVILKDGIEMAESTDDEQPEDQDCGNPSEQVEELEADGEPPLKF